MMMGALPEPRRMRRDTVYVPAAVDEAPQFRLVSATLQNILHEPNIQFGKYLANIHKFPLF